MPAIDFDSSLPREGYSPDQWYPSVDSSKEKGIVLGRFVDRQIVDRAKSKLAGEYIYRDVIGCYQKPASSDDVSYKELVANTAEELLSKYPDAWKAFDDQRPKPEGTTLRGVSFLNKRDIYRLLGLGVETLEQLAKLTDTKAKTVFGVPALKRQAKSWLLTNAKTKETSGDSKDNMSGRAK
jgi:hypothetical protein